MTDIVASWLGLVAGIALLWYAFKRSKSQATSWGLSVFAILFIIMSLAVGIAPRQ